MPRVNTEVERIFEIRESFSASKRIAATFEDAYVWLDQMNVHLHPDETVGTIAFSSNGESKVRHLTWSDLIQLHRLFECLRNLEKDVADPDSERRQ